MEGGFADWLVENGLEDGEGDFDGDRIPNIVEFVYGSDAKTADTQLGPQMALVDGVQAFVYPSRADHAGVTVEVQGSMDLIEWEVIAGPGWETTEGALPGAPEGVVQVSVKRVSDQADDIRYLRLAVTQD